MLILIYRFQRTVSIHEITQTVFGMTTEISESAKLAEEYYGKTVECSSFIETCAGKIHDLSAQLSSFNTQLAASARKSLGNIRSSIDSLLSVDSSDRPVSSVQAAILEVEQLKSEQIQLSRRYEREQVQLSQRCDRLLEFLRRHASQMERSGGAGLFPQQNVDRCDDIEPVTDEVLLLSVPDSMSTDELDADARHTVISEPNDGSAAMMPPPAAEIQCPTSSADDALVSDAIVSNSSTRELPSRKNTTGDARVAPRSRSAKCTSAGHVEPTVIRARQKSSDARGKSSVTRSCGTVNSSQELSGTLHFSSASSLSNEVESTEAESKSRRPQSRGRVQVRQRCTVRTKSAVQSSHYTASSSETTAVKTGRYKRSNSAAQENAVRSNAAITHQHNVSNVVGSDGMLQSAVPFNPSQESSKSEAVKSPRHRTKSATVAVRKKTLAGAVISRRGLRSQPHQLAGGGGMMSARRRNYTSPANVIQFPVNTSVMNINVNGDFLVAADAAASATSPSHSVTTYLSGPRTDIFRQHSPPRTVDAEVSFKPAASTFVTATG